MNEPALINGVLIAGTALVAVWTLVSLMRQRRDLLIKQVQEQLAEQRELRLKEEKRKRRQQGL